MSSDALCLLPAAELASLIRRRAVSPLEAVDAHLARIETHDDAVHAYVTVLAERAREDARRAERALISGERLGVLHGVPVAVKDETAISGVPSTFGCPAMRAFVPEADGTTTRQLRAAGAIVLGKTNMPEFGHKGTTDNQLVGPTSSPFGLDRNAGGSSGGSAAAVAAGFAPLAQGGDGGGSTRIPASLCGVYGLKPSWGRVPWVDRPNAFMAHTPFLGLNGPLARTVEDAALWLTATAGYDSRDPLCLPPADVDYRDALLQPIAGLRIAFSEDFGLCPVDPEIARIVTEAVGAFEALGAHVERVAPRLPAGHDELVPLWRRMAGVHYAEMMLTFARDGIELEHRGDISPDLFGYVAEGRALSAVDAKLDDQLRTGVFDAIEDVFDRYDLIVTPTVAVPPPVNATDGRTVGPEAVNGVAVDPLLGWTLAYPLNFTGHPAASIPAGFDRDGLPVGLQIAGRRFRDDVVLSASAAFERARPWHTAYERTLAPVPALATAD